MENNKDNKKHDEGIKAEGFPTFEEKRETAGGVTASSKEKQSAKPMAMDTASNEQLSEQEAKAKAAAAAAPEPIPEPKPSDVKPTVAKPKQPASDSFSLEDILAEFSDE